jgi:hypothetical protein
VYPAAVRNSWNPAVHVSAFMRAQLRDLLRRLPHGWSTFRKLEGLYALAPNPAVLASAARAPFLLEVLERLQRIPAALQPRPNVIGPHLLQRTVAAYRGADLVVYPPEVFFPLGPEISEHWFRTVRHADLSAVLAPTTRLVHWYASVRTKHVVPQVDPDYVRRNADTQLFSALALPFAEA